MMKKAVLIGLTLFTATCAVQVHAEEIANKESKVDLNPAVSLQIGADALDTKLGLGAWNDNVHFMFYVSHFQSDATTSVGGTDIGKTKYRSTRLGIDVNSYRTELAGGTALKGGFFLYKNDSDLNTGRYGVGVNFFPVTMITEKLQVYTGLSLMPEFLSSDWNAKVALEYEIHAGVSYRITPIFDAGISYRMSRTLDDISVGFYSLPMLELSLRL